MKNMKTRTLALILTLALALIPALSLVSCGKRAVMSCGNVEITEDLYEYWMGAYKAKLIESYSDVKDTSAYWSSMINDTQTAEEYLTEMVDTILRHKLVSVYIFDQSGFVLSDDDREEINDYLDLLVSDFTENGKKSEFDDYCEQFGIDYKGVRLMLTMEYKAEALGEMLFGEKGKNPLGVADYKAYYDSEYCRVKEIWINTAFKYVTDEKGNRVTDEDGYYKTEDLTEEELAAAESRAAELEAKLEGITTDEEFEKLIDEYSDFEMNKEYPNGMYFCAGTTYIDKVVNAALKLEVGEMTNVESSYGKHYIRAYALEEGAYEEKENEDFFGDFEAQAVNYYIEREIAKYKDMVEVDLELKNTFTLSKVKTNKYYFY